MLPALLVVCLALASAPLEGQLVRGTIREAGSNAPLAGVVVAIQPAAPATAAGSVSPLAVTLTNTRGEYAVSPGDSGRFLITAKRIGVRQFQSGTLALARGETRQLDITLEAVRFSLPIVTVSAATPCSRRDENRGRIAALWEEARAALTASELSLRERLFRATVTRYQRQLEPRTLAVRGETRNTQRGVTEQAFVSVPAESLAVHGYARVLPDGMIEHFAPDERVLLSEWFVRDHCFALAPGGEGREVGITFTPTRDRRVSDVQGTIWFDARSYELRRVNFRYTNFPLPVNDIRTGGEVQFTRMANGVWYVSRWYMRTPRVELHRTTAGNPRNPRTEDRPVIVAFSEVGGLVVADDSASAARVLATINGRVVDSTGNAPLPGARLLLRGLNVSATSGRDGAFRLGGVPQGNFTLIAEHPAYSRLGILVGEQLLEIAEGGSSVTLLQAPDSRQILRQLCGYDEVPDSIVVMRLALVPPPSASEPNREDIPATLHLTWSAGAEIVGGVVRSRTREGDFPIDAVGGVTACSLPRDVALRVESRDAAGKRVKEWELRTPERGWTVSELRR